MNIVYDTLMTLLPGRRKKTSSGWTSINGVCCVHNGETPDTRGRLSITMGSLDDGVIVRCFNCKFSTIWKPGQPLGRKMKNFLGWMGMPDEQIKKLGFNIWQANQQMRLDVNYKPKEYVALDFKPAALPPGARPVLELLAENCEDPNYLLVMEYLLSRGDDIFEGYDYYWTPNKTGDMNRKLIIPFKWKGQIVGYTARACFPTKHRYFSDVQGDYIFNTEVTENDWEYLFVCEGPFDAIAINGVAVLGGTIGENQVRWLKQTGKNIIVVPDMEKGGGPLVDTAVKEGWRVSFPKWDKGIKDGADAVKAYGKLYTVWSIIDAQVENRLEINVRRQRLR